MNQWDDLAGAVRRANRKSEAEDIEHYDGAQVKQAIVHMREDITMIAVHMSSLNKQISTVRVLLFLILAVLVFIAIKPYF